MNEFPSNEIALEMYRRMLLIRVFEEEGERLASLGQIVAAYHSSIGEEATRVGSGICLRKDDLMTGTHRTHGQAIAKGADLGPMAAEILGKVTGTSKGKGGSLHIANFAVGCLGATGIVSSAMPVAVGAALGIKMQKKDAVTLCYFGDGAANEGLFHESLNLASVWKLPVVFLCENNQYAVSTYYRRVTAIDLISKTAPSYAMPGITVDGQNVFEVYQACKQAVERARAGLGPSLVECLTYRYREHSLRAVFRKRVGEAVYRSDWEVEQWVKRDPLEICCSWLLHGQVASEENLKAMREEVVAQVKAAWKFGLDSPPPPEDEIWADTWVEPLQPQPLH